MPKYAITGKEKLKHIKSYFGVSEKPLKIADIGGMKITADFLKSVFPKAEIITINNYKPHLEGCKGVLADIEKDNLKLRNVDAVFAFDVIEHLTDSDMLILNAKRILKDGGMLVITTPNLASLFNRLFLLTGKSLPNYHPARYRTGNRFLKVKESIPLWNENAHKSVFTFEGLRELLEIYGFRVLRAEGYSYFQSEGSEAHVKLRKFVDRLTPKGMKEGMAFFCRLDKNKT